MRLSKSLLVIIGICFLTFQIVFIALQHHSLHVEEVYAQILATVSSVAFIALVSVLGNFDEKEITIELTLMEFFFAINAVGFQVYNVFKLMTRV